MPRSKNPAKYPTVFKDLLLAAYAAGEVGITWKCPDLGTAKRTRMQLYAYVNAVEKSEENMALPDEFRESPRMHQIQITTKAEATGGSIHLLNKNFAPENLAIQAALAVLGPLNPDTPEDIEARSKAAAIIAEAEAEPNPATAVGSSEPAVPDIPLEGDLSSLFKT